MWKIQQNVLGNTLKITYICIMGSPENAGLEKGKQRMEEGRKG